MDAQTLESGLAMRNDERDGNQRDGRDGRDAITESTKVPLSIAVGCVSVFVIGALWLNNSLNRIEQRLTIIELGTNDRIRASDFKSWVLQLRHDNPNLNIPSVYQQNER